MVKQLTTTYQIKIQLQGTKPPIWRRFLISELASLHDFHLTIQIIMGWTNSHMHQFITENARYGMVDSNVDWDNDLKNEMNFNVKDILKAPKDYIFYEYDFGDDWSHKITLEKISPFNPAQFLPHCVKGKRACPPEDVGGVWGYSDFLEQLNDKNHPEHEDVKEWIGGDFHAEAFDDSQINKILRDVFIKK